MTWHYASGSEANPGPSAKDLRQKPSPNCRRRVSTYATGRKQTDPAGVMEAPTLIKAGEGPLVYSFRAGDYAIICWDPVTNTSWVANEFATLPSSNRWGTYIANIVPRGGGPNSGLIASTF